MVDIVAINHSIFLERNFVHCFRRKEQVSVAIQMK